LFPQTTICAPELFQQCMSSVLAGLSGVVCLMDNVLVLGKNQAKYDEHLEAVLKRLVSAGVTLNTNKYEFSKSELKFLGHFVNQHGVQADPDTTKAILATKEHFRNAMIFWHDESTVKVHPM